MRSTTRKALVFATSALAIAMMSQTPAGAADYLNGTELVNVCTPHPSADLPSACVCVDESTCTFDVFYKPGNAVSTPAGFVCLVMPGSVEHLLDAGEPRVENPCDGFPYN